jgi:hypothetical protein
VAGRFGGGLHQAECDDSADAIGDCFFSGAAGEESAGAYVALFEDNSATGICWPIMRDTEDSGKWL